MPAGFGGQQPSPGAGALALAGRIGAKVGPLGKPVRGDKWGLLLPLGPLSGRTIVWRATPSPPAAGA